jgi:hypothetical protein
MRYSIRFDLDSGCGIEDSALVEADSAREALDKAQDVRLTGTPASEVVTRYYIEGKQVTCQQFMWMV